jgi:hypothetical protein
MSALWVGTYGEFDVPDADEAIDCARAEDQAVGMEL